MSLSPGEQMVFAAAYVQELEALRVAGNKNYMMGHKMPTDATISDLAAAAALEAVGLLRESLGRFAKSDDDLQLAAAIKSICRWP